MVGWRNRSTREITAEQAFFISGRPWLGGSAAFLEIRRRWLQCRQESC